MSRAQRTAQKALLAVLKTRMDPHGAGPFMNEKWLKAVEVDLAGHCQLKVAPSRPHCPCCLADLADLRALLAKKRGITSCTIEVVEVPDAHRWSAAINA